MKLLITKKFNINVLKLNNKINNKELMMTKYLGNDVYPGVVRRSELISILIRLILSFYLNITCIHFLDKGKYKNYKKKT